MPSFTALKDITKMALRMGSANITELAPSIKIAPSMKFS
jgi:hypothetical protein